MNDSRRPAPARRQWLFLLLVLLVALVIAFAPGWVSGLIGVVVLLGLGYGGVALYYRRYQQFHQPEDHQ